MILVVMLSLSGCSSQKSMVATAPFEMGGATCQNWIGGRAEAGSGILLEIPILSGNTEETKLQQAFFRGKIADVVMERSDNVWVAKANFKNQNGAKPDMVMDADSKKEIGNQPPELMKKFPFELQDDQCVLSFMDGGTTKYFKVDGIKEKTPKIYK